MQGEYAKRDQKWHSRPKNDGYAICTQEYILQNCRFFYSPPGYCSQELYRL